MYVNKAKAGIQPTGPITRLVGNNRVYRWYGCWLVITNQHPHPMYTLLLPTSLVMAKGGSDEIETQFIQRKKN